MAQPVYSTWPEAAYALGLTKAMTWPAQRSVVEIFCAHAFAQGVIAGEVACSERDLASHLHGGRRSVNAAGELLDKLVDRRVLRLLEKGTGTAPSVFALWHWTRWDVPWRVDPERAGERIGAFAMAQIRAQSGSSARVYIRALTTSARMFSQDVSELARGPIDPRASDLNAFKEPLVEALQSARYGARALGSHLSMIESSALSLQGGSELSQRTVKLVSAVRDSCGVKWLARGFVARLCRLAAESNGRFPELAARAADPSGPKMIAERLDWLEEGLSGAPPFAPKSAERRRLESTIAALELSGEGESEDANGARQRLAKLGA
jgi:hypothetical protein